MNQYKYLIIIKGEDHTEEIEKIENGNQKINVKFKNNSKIYPYYPNNIEILYTPTEINIFNSTIEIINSGELFNVLTCLDFGKYYKFIHENGESEFFPNNMVKFTENTEKTPQKSINLFSYFKSVSENVTIKSEDGRKLLTDEYNKINFLSKESILSKYLTPSINKEVKFRLDKTLIFPFGANASQIKAVRNAMSSQVSIIEGPPGTGKTQTILNIIANIIMENKTVAIVSNNNSATLNVYEKMCKYDFGFLCAVLGNRDNKDDFINNQEEKYPDIIVDLEDKEKISQKTKKIVDELAYQFEIENGIQNFKRELQQLQLEWKHYINENEDAEIIPKLRNNTDTSKLFKLKLECDEKFFDKNKVSIFFKIKAIFWYGIGDRRFYKQLPNQISKQYNNAFYHIKDKELNDMIEKDSRILKYRNFEDVKKQLSKFSMDLLKNKLSNKYNLKSKRPKFEIKDLSANNKKFSEEYPVVLSTTHSIKNCLGKDFLYDYVIVDEASQVDLVTGILALSSAKNIIVVGDLKQLHNVIEESKKSQLEKLAQKYNIPLQYDYNKNSFLSSMHAVFDNAPSTLLKEHYRCHPKIIGFCNRKFYDNQLIIMTSDKGEEDIIKAYKTVEGNHARGHINQRQIDEISENILPDLEKIVAKDEIGIISPYKAQKEAIKFADIQVDTVHKFQGREKDAIILTTVENEISDFVDNPNMLNVAISRAKKFLRVVVSNNEANDKSNIGDLIRYIQYNNFEVNQSEINSIYDLLYKSQASYRKELLKNHKKISEYDSENITQALIEEILDIEEFSMLDVADHVELKHVVKNSDGLSADEWNYASNEYTHLDFIIYRKIDNSVVLAIEVDGYKYHNENEKQLKRDKKKESILKKRNIELLRLNTTGSNEKNRIITTLQECLNYSISKTVDLAESKQ